MSRREKKELQQKKIESYEKAILAMIAAIRTSGAEYDIENLIRQNPRDRGVILLAERAAFRKTR